MSIMSFNTVSVNVPQRQLAEKSLQVTTVDNKRYSDWTEKDHSNSFTMLQQIISDQNLVYGKIQKGVPFNWEMVPYQKTKTIIGRIWQQFCVLWRITFGGIKSSKKHKYEKITTVEKVSTVGNDAFCKKEVINKQLVLEGRRVNILYNYAPIGFGGERLHFLVVPKEHRTDFKEVNKEEYVEACELTERLINQCGKTRRIQETYLYHKSGKDAGQSVPHWHMHVVMTTNAAQGFFGKLTVLKNMLFGSSPMKDSELKNKVTQLKNELT